MPATYFGFALADSMFAGDCDIRRRAISIEAVRARVDAGVVPCLNPSHEASVEAMRARFGLDVPIPADPPRVVLGPGDALIVMGVRGLPRLTDRHHYTADEIAAADFQFHEYRVRA